MKTKQKLLILTLAIIFCFIGLIKINNNRVIRSVKSEKELKELGEWKELSFLESLFTLPFSLIVQNSYTYKGIDYVDYVNSPNSYDLEMQASSQGNMKDYSKTNIQVEGVDEADIIKTDGDYIYSISENNVIVTNTKDPNNTYIESKINTGSTIANDLLLYKNYLVVILYSNTTGRWGNQNTLVEVYDVKDKSNIKKVKSFELYEPYYTSRCIDGDLYIFSSGYLREEDGKIVRTYKEDFDVKEIDLKDIKYIKNNETQTQTLIAHLDLNDLKDFDIQSYLIDISNAYVSKDNIYLMDNYYGDYISIGSLFTFKGIIGFIMDDIERSDFDSKTKIYKFEINKDKGVIFKTTTNIKGKINNQYSLDEKNNHLRIALETSKGTRVAILDEKLKLIGETQKVAEGEKMYASRFIGDKAYLVTYRNTDPLFVIDLSNEKNPKVMGELKIPGYSTYLHPYDETHLIGIGMDTEEII